jgi:L-asparagine transporter-like permease
MNKNYLHISVAAALTFALLALADLFPFWMPMMGEMVALALVTLLLIVWTGFVMQETAQDEREVVLKMRAGRVAYLSGLGFLALALIVQALSHDIDPWIATALAVMVLAKLLTRLYLE